jgi:hypothetical protein
MTQSSSSASILFGILFAVPFAINNTRALENKSFYLNEALVHHVSPGEATKDFAVIIILGHNHSSYIYLTTPDGREGWAQQVAQAGYEVYVINDPKFDIAIFFSTNTP